LRVNALQEKIYRKADLKKTVHTGVFDRKMNNNLLIVLYPCQNGIVRENTDFREIE